MEKTVRRDRLSRLEVVGPMILLNSAMQRRIHITLFIILFNEYSNGKYMFKRKFRNVLQHNEHVRVQSTARITRPTPSTATAEVTCFPSSPMSSDLLTSPRPCSPQLVERNQVNNWWTTPAYRCSHVGQFRREMDHVRHSNWSNVTFTSPPQQTTSESNHQYICLQQNPDTGLQTCSGDW